MPGERPPLKLRFEDEIARPTRRPPRSTFGRRFLVMGVTAAFVVAISVVGALAVLSDDPRPGIIHLSTLPKDALVKFDNQPVTDNSSPYVILNVKPHVTHSLEIGKSGYQTQMIEGISINSNQIKKLPPVVLRPTESGFTLDSAPSDAKVWVDGKELAQQTPVKVTALAPGSHEVRVEREGFVPWQTRIDVTSGAMQRLPDVSLLPQRVPAAAPNAQLRKQPVRKAQAESVDASQDKPRRPVVLFAQGVLRVKSRTSVQVYVDGQFIGNAPLPSVKLEPGSHQVKLVNTETNLTKNITVDIPPGETVNVNYDFADGT